MGMSNISLVTNNKWDIIMQKVFVSLYIRKYTKWKSKDKFPLYLMELLYIQHNYSETRSFLHFCHFQTCRGGILFISFMLRYTYYYTQQISLLNISEIIPIVCSTSIFYCLSRGQAKPILWRSDNICCILINTMCIPSFTFSCISLV